MHWGSVFAFSGADGSLLWETKEPPFPEERQVIPSLGQYLASVADIDGDGWRDLLAAAPYHDIDPNEDEELSAGRNHILSGRDGSILRIDENPAVSADGDFFGGTVASLCDLDGDSTEDYAVGERGENRVHLFSGGTGALIRSLPVPADESSGQGVLALAGAADRNGNGVCDLWVGAPRTGKVVLLDSLGSVLAEVSGMGNPASLFGFPVSATADLDGDGVPDGIVGESHATGPAGEMESGAAWVLLANQPPVANAGPDQIVSAGADCRAQVTLDGTGSTDPDGDVITYTWEYSARTASGPQPTINLGLGTHTLTLTVDDGQGGSSTDDLVITVEDRTPPVASATASPDVLWPPNHQMIPIHTSISALDNCGPTFVSAPSITVNEGDRTSTFDPAFDSTVGDGHTTGDVQVDGAGNIALRAERSGTGGGRVYTITYTVTDGARNSIIVSTTVSVPRNRE
jgi:hypothetical protein